jgi:hypothetical protein
MNLTSIKPMKNSMVKLKIPMIGLAAVLMVSAARADLEVSASVSINAVGEFEEPLSSHGAWVQVGSYGRCWRPARVAVEWRPYCEGEWVWTDCGWYWSSDEPWAWACYHYGNWVYDPVHYWIWVPGTEWAPAWVSWRVGGGYYGWAPLGPRGMVVAPSHFVFVETQRFHGRVRPSTVVINNTTVFQKTTVINNISRETRTVAGESRRVVVNNGPGIEPIRKASGKPVAPVPIQVASARTPAPAAVAKRGRPDKADKADKGDKVNAPATEKPAETTKPAPNTPAKVEETQQPKEVKKETRPEPRPEPRTEPRLEPKPETKPVPRPEPAPKHEPKPEPPAKELRPNPPGQPIQPRQPPAEPKGPPRRAPKQPKEKGQKDDPRGPAARWNGSSVVVVAIC